MSRFQNRSLRRYSVLCTLAVLTGGMAHAGIFHKKDKPLSQKDDALASVTSSQPDKELFDRAMKALKKGKFDIARLDLQTLLNTYPDSEYAMRSKLAIGDTWYKEGGAAALQQAEEEYKDFITFFPDKPEAAEAQMKVADIYYKQMEKPDRDPTNATRAQEEYRTMILQYPDSSLIPQAKQRLREVQEVLGDHEFAIGNFYETRANYAGSIARLQSVIDTYPLYSHIDSALLDVGDAYEAQAQNIKTMRLDPAAKARLLKLYTQRATDAYDRVILEYPMAVHVDDARDKLEAMGKPVPQPTQQAVAESAAIEQSRAPVNLKYKAVLLITARPSVVQASRVGEPSLTDSAQIIAPAVVKESIADVKWAMKPEGKPAPSLPGGTNNMQELAMAAANAAQTPNSSTGAGQPSAPAGNNGLQMNDLSGDNDVNGAVVNNNDTTNQTQPVPKQAVQPPVGSAADSKEVPKPGTVPGGTAGGPPAVWPSAKNDNGGLPTVAPKDNTPLPAAQRASSAPMPVNDVTQTGPAPNTVDQNTAATGKKHKKNPKVKFNGKEESSSKHKKKTGLHKLY
jgi:outer membrane protein assembly factor BamD